MDDNLFATVNEMSLCHYLNSKSWYRDKSFVESPDPIVLFNAPEDLVVVLV